jgi:hypothetical protein
VVLTAKMPVQPLLFRLLTPLAMLVAPPSLLTVPPSVAAGALIAVLVDVLSSGVLAQDDRTVGDDADGDPGRGDGAQNRPV